MEVIQSHFSFYTAQDPGQFATQSAGRGLKWGENPLLWHPPGGANLMGYGNGNGTGDHEHAAAEAYPQIITRSHQGLL
ncbi:hypothetical protein Goklo_024842 [Gossypium klotzschianum]|uniref:Uncharacterized protein n=1 Tax=Gossypium klotzschianum TaxID=34286 RepID=A0A7J8WFM6_9ROSI|nr:hypothetical protein [Gossypium klotzschianum]